MNEVRLTTKHIAPPYTSEVTIEVVCLAMEEDEVFDREFPLLFNNESAAEDSDECLVREGSQTSVHVTMSSVGLIKETTLTLRRGRCRFPLSFGDEPGDHTILIVDTTTGAEYRACFPVGPVRGVLDSDQGSSKESAEESSEESVDLDEFEDDGFVVLSGDEDDDDEVDEENDDEGDAENDNDDAAGQDDNGTCCVCGSETSATWGIVLVCDGCESETHLRCTSLSEVPEGDWFCGGCNCDVQSANELQDATNILEEASRSSSEDGDVSRCRKRKIRRRSAAHLSEESE